MNLMKPTPTTGLRQHDVFDDNLNYGQAPPPYSPQCSDRHAVSISQVQKAFPFLRAVKISCLGKLGFVHSRFDSDNRLLDFGRLPMVPYCRLIGDLLILMCSMSLMTLLCQIQCVFVSKLFCGSSSFPGRS